MMKDECGMMNWYNESNSLDFHELRNKDNRTASWVSPEAVFLKFTNNLAV